MDGVVINSMSKAGTAKVRELEKAGLKLTQTFVATKHLLHGGIYSRTIIIPAGAVASGALIRVATTMVISGDATVFLDDGVTKELSGYNVIPASANRKQAVFAHTDVAITASHKTDAKTVEEAQLEATDEVELLVPLSNTIAHSILITGE